VPHHTKDKGDLGVFKAQADLPAQGYLILLPLTEHAPFDLVVYKHGTFRRVQVRYRSCGSHGCLNVRLRSIWNDRHGMHVRPMDKDEVDVICVYCPDTDECYYFNPRRTNQSLTLRVKPTRNCQRIAVKLAADYRRMP
jgi:hypothetical protein